MREVDAPAPQTTGRRWYGGQTLAADLSSIALLLVSAASASHIGDDAAVVAVGGYLLGSPIIHLAHGNAWAAGGSLVLHAGLPVAGFYAGEAATSCPDGTMFCGFGAGLEGGLIGVVGAIVIDAAALAYEEAPPATSSARPVSSLRLFPVVGRGGAGVSVGGEL